MVRNLIFKDYCIQEVLEKVSGGTCLVCFGAGRYLERLCEKYASYDLAGKITILVDNDAAKWGKNRELLGHRLCIHSLHDAIALAQEKSVLFMITIVDFRGIWEQLYVIPELDHSGVVVPAFMEEREMFWKQDHGWFEFDIHHDKRYAIPKVIHYCWFGRKPIPERNRIWMESWRRLCPDFEIKEWNETNYDVRKISYMAEAYDAGKWGFVSDYARLDIIFQYGGFYLDTDVELLKSLDDLTEQQAFFGFETLESVGLGIGFGAVSHHPLIQEMRDDYCGKHFLQKDGSLNLLPSPAYWTSVLQRHDLQLDGRFQQLECANVYPKTAFCPQSYELHCILDSEDTISIHHFDASWQNENERMNHMKRMELFEKCRANCAVIS